MFRHEDFGGQLLWALERGLIVDTEGPEETFFNQPPPAAVAAPPPPPAAATDQVQQHNNYNKDGVGMMKSKTEWKSFHQSSKTSWLVVGTILTLMITWLQQEQLPWPRMTTDELQRMCQLLPRQ